MLKYYPNRVIHNEKINYGVGIVTGWKNAYNIYNLVSDINKDKVASCGNLYTTNGINFIIANLFNSPSINHLIFLEDSGLNDEIAESIQMMKKFLNNETKIDYSFNFTDNDIDIFKQHFRNNITFTHSQNLNQFLESYKPITKNWTDQKEFEKIITTLDDNLPSEGMSFNIRANRIADAWQRAIKLVNTYGSLKKSDYDEEQREIINLSIVIKNEDINNPYLPKFLNLEPNFLNKYIDELLYGFKTPDITYTYGTRLRNFRNVDQLLYMTNELKKAEYSRRAVATLWDPLSDTKEEEVPCINSYQAIIQNDTLYLVAYIRSNDIVNAWPSNAFGLLNIQDYLCKELNVKKGYINTIAGSSHIYSRDFPRVDEYLKNNIINFCEEDERGYFTIEVEDNIIVKLFAPEGRLIRTFEGKTAQEIGHQVDFYISNISHARYIGSELQKAELALTNDLVYIQDQNLNSTSLQKVLRKK